GDGIGLWHGETLKGGGIRAVLVHRNSAGSFVREGCARYNFGSMNRRTCSVQFSTKRVVIAVLAMIRFGMRVGGGAHMLKIGFRQRRLVRRQWMMGCTAGGKENKGDEGRQQD